MSEQEGIFGREDVISRLGVRVVTHEEATRLEQEAQSTSVVQWRAAPTLVAIGNDLDRVAATTSMGPNREGARRRWNERRVMRRDRDGNRTNIPLIVDVAFTTEDWEYNQRPDDRIIQRQEVEGLGFIFITPLFIVNIAYVRKTEDGRKVPTKVFHGVLYAPMKPRQPYEFVPLEFADSALVARWNDMIDQGKTYGTIHKDWPKIEPIKTKIGHPGLRLMQLAPRYQIKKTFEHEERGRVLKQEVWIIDTQLSKLVVLDPKSPDMPIIDADGEYPFGEFVFRYTEQRRSITVYPMGRPDEIDLTFSNMDLSDISFEMNPFEILGVSIEQFEPGAAKRFVKRCLNMEPNERNPLYMRTVEFQLIAPRMSMDAIKTQLAALAQDTLRRAESLWKEAFNATVERLNRFDLPTLEALLAGNRLDVTIEKLNPDDAAVAWITSHIEGEYNHASPFHRALRAQLLRDLARHAGYLDPPLPKIEPIREEVIIPPRE